VAIQRGDHFRMKRACFFLFSFFFVASACNSPKGKDSEDTLSAAASARDSIAGEDYSDEGEYYENLSCDDLRDKNVLLHFAMQHAFTSSPTSSFDTSQIVAVSGHFIDNKSLQTLVWIADYPMPSCGDGCNLVMLFSCDHVARMIFSTTAGVFSKEDVRDLNGDGVLEIIAGNSICRMGECHEHYEIFNLADTAKNVLYHAHSFSYVEETWGDNYEGYFKKGDTISVAISPTLVDAGNGILKIKQVREVKTYNGGKTIDGIRADLITGFDSAVVSLKKIK
jgi:hypothetical protein